MTYAYVIDSSNTARNVILEEMIYVSSNIKPSNVSQYKNRYPVTLGVSNWESSVSFVMSMTYVSLNTNVVIAASMFVPLTVSSKFFWAVNSPILSLAIKMTSVSRCFLLTIPVCEITS